MSEELGRSETGMAGQALAPGAAAPAPVAGPARSGGRRAIFIVGGIIAFLAIVLFVVRNNVAANDLRVGDCFTIPDGTTVATVERLACTQTHNAEVIFVGEYTGASFPISLSLNSYVEEQCVPAFETYVGRPIDAAAELSLAYLHPTRDSWDGGDRTITCYISRADESPLTESLRSS